MLKAAIPFRSMISWSHGSDSRIKFGSGVGWCSFARTSSGGSTRELLETARWRQIKGISHLDGGKRGVASLVLNPISAGMANA
jgi:hypothetical protein